MKIFIPSKNSFETILVFFDQALYSGSNFILTVFLAHHLNCINFGFFSTIVLMTLLVMSATNALIIQPFQVSLSQTQDLKKYITFLGIGQLLLILLLCIILYPFLSLFSDSNGVNNVPYYSVTLFFSGYLIQDFFRKIFLGLAQLKKVILIDILFIFIIVIGFCITKKSDSVSVSLTIIGYANLLSSIVGLSYFIKNFSLHLPLKTFLKTHYDQGKWLLCTAFLQWSSSNFFILTSGMYLGIEALGALRLVQSIFGIINIALQTVENYFLPKISLLFHKNPLLAKKYIFKITSHGGIIFGTLLVLIISFDTEIIKILGGEKYLPFAYIIRIMTILYCFIFIGYPLRIAIRILTLNKIFFIGYLISFFTSLLTFHFLLHYLALSGAIIGLIINQVVMLLYWQKQLHKKHIFLWK